MLDYLRIFLQRRPRRIRPDRSQCIMFATDTLELRQLLSATTVEFGAVSDTTIYAQDVDSSNGGGQFIVAGGGARGLLKFDVAIPEGSTIVDAVLTLSAGAAAGGGAAVSVHRLTTAWGEGGSDASGDEYQGAPAQSFDATWQYSFFDGEQWGSPGGDFAGSSASASVDGVGTYEWIGGGLIDDVQSWVDNAATNFGWLLDASGSATAFLSKDSPGGLGPSLEITYEAPPGPPATIEGRLWNDVNGDGRRSDPLLADLDLSPVNGDTYFDVFGGQEHWFRSGSDGRWYFLREGGELTRWDGTSQTLSGDLVGTIDSIYYQQPSLVTGNTDDVEPWLNGWTVELIDELGNVAQTTQTGGFGGGAGSDSDGGWYQFTVAGGEEYTVRQVVPDGWTEGVRIELESSSPGEGAINGLALYFSGSYHQNWGGQDERWMRSDQRGWHYVTPDGSLYRWDGNAVTDSAPLSGTLVANVGTAYYDDPANGQIDTGSGTATEQVTRVDFGNVKSQTVRGRVWLDFFENGLLDTIQVTPNQFELYPVDTLAADEEWFYDYLNDDWYIIDADGEPRFFAHDDDLDDDFNRPQPGPGGPQLTFVETVTEPWLNNKTVELVDRDGNVVATTTSESIDLNGDGEIQFETERGWYVFEDVPTGDYTVRMGSEDGWQQTSPVSETQATAIELQGTFNFETTANDFHNWGGLNERWVRDGQDNWHYITEDGSLYLWEVGTRESSGGLRGTLVATLSSDYHNDLKLLTEPDTASLTVRVEEDSVSTDILFGTRRLLSDLIAEAELFQFEPF